MSFGGQSGNNQSNSNSQSGSSQSGSNQSGSSQSGSAKSAAPVTLPVTGGETASVLPMLLGGVGALTCSGCAAAPQDVIT